MLDASMERRYSANPGEAFSTGGGLQVFHNFEPEDDARIMSVRDAFRNSVNLPFIRLMRDVVNYHLYREPESIGRILEDPADPRREAYLTRFADREGSEFVRRFYRKHHGLPVEEALELVDEVQPELVLVDVRMPGLGGVETARALSVRDPDLVVVLVSLDDPPTDPGAEAIPFVRKQDFGPGLLRELWEAHGSRRRP